MINSHNKLKILMSRPTIIAGNWKMHKTIQETIEFVQTLSLKVTKPSCQVLIAPPFTAISHAAMAAKGAPIMIGAQNMSDVDEGAFTGEISLRMIKEAGARFVILGHSERRIYFKETDEHINHKLRKASSEKFPAIFCIGENQKEREAGHSEQVLKTQLDKGLQSIPVKHLETLMIAYEPVWAIGTGKTATPELAQETHVAIRQHLANVFGSFFAEKVPILYGGSVKPENINTLIQQPDIDGALIGGASLDVKSFTQMVLS